MEGRRALRGWGRTSPSVAMVHSAGDDAELVRLVTDAGPRGVLARGLGRSYGDAAQNGGGVVVDMTARHRVLSVDNQTGLVEVEAGASLDELMRQLLPLGLFVPVSPGTRQVTVGGAVAADIHGKNHHVDGSFGRHIVSMDLLCADGTIRTLTPESELFWATVGGMGLTGLVLRVTLRMKKVQSAYCLVDTERCANLDDLLGRMTEGDHRYTYSVAWIDCLARGSSLGRSVLTRGWSANIDQLPPKLRDHALDFRPKQLAVAPPIFPSGLLNRATVAAFNEAWYRKAPHERHGEIQSSRGVLPPLGRRGAVEPHLRSEGFLAVPFRGAFRRRGRPAAMHPAVERRRSGLVPRGTQAVRTFQRRSSVVSHSRLDARAGHTDRRGRAGRSARPPRLRGDGRRGSRVPGKGLPTVGIPDRGYVSSPG